MSTTAPQVHELDPDERVAVALSFADRLEPGETLQTPTVTTEAGPSLTISGEGVNGSVMDINNIAVPIGQAAVCYVEGATLGTDYVIKISCATSTSQTRVGYCELRCRS